MSQKIIPAGPARTELQISNSRFITSASPAFTVKEAKEYISEIKAQYADASHNVPAFMIGHGASTTSHCSDDGEPSGTAGRPALAVLKGSGISDIAVVITRYFGGSKLGTGGLVRAYSDSMRSIIAAIPKAQKVSTQTVMMAIPYDLFERTEILVSNNEGLLIDKDFGVDITLTAQFQDHNLPRFQQALGELSHGKVQVEVIDANPNTIMPLKT